MKIGVVQFPGSNCERETKLALTRVGFEPADCFWTATENSLHQLDGFVIVGGFSYEDRVRSGLIAALEPFMKLLIAQAQQGKPILGICNGAQILVESGLIGGPIALTANKRMEKNELLGSGFFNDWVEIEGNRAPVTHPIHLPIAHAEGRFLIDDSFYQHLKQSNAWLYTYRGKNPNGSMHQLAAVSNAAGNVMAMMPHPERTPAGDVILKSFFSQARPSVVPAPMTQALDWQPYVPNQQAAHFWVSLAIHDNEAISLENTLQQLGHAVSLEKLIHWEIEGLNAHDQSVLLKEDYLFNPQKEYLKEIKNPPVYLVRAHDDEHALEKQHMLSHCLHKPIIVKRDVVWCSQAPLPKEALALLGNPLSHQGYVL